MYLLRLVLRPWRAAPFLQLTFSGSLGFSLFLLCFLIWFHQSLSPVLNRIHNGKVLTVFLEANRESASIAATEPHPIEDKIRMAVGAQRNVQIKSVGSSQFLKDLKQDFPDLSDELESLGAEAESLLPRYISVTGSLDEDAASRIQKIPGVSSVEVARAGYTQGSEAFFTLRWILRVVIVGIFMAFGLGWILWMRHQLGVNDDVFDFFKLWGASYWQVKLPSLLIGAFSGLIMGGGAAGLLLLVGPKVLSQIQNLSPLLKELSRFPLPWVGLLPVLTLLFSLLLAGVVKPLSQKSFAMGRFRE